MSAPTVAEATEKVLRVLDDYMALRKLLGGHRSQTGKDLARAYEELEAARERESKYNCSGAV